MQTDKGEGLVVDKTISKPRLDRTQRKGVKLIERCINRNGGCLLADEMGIGKTPQVLKWLKIRPDSFPALVVCPASAIYIWERECRKWCTEDVIVAEKAGDIDVEWADVIVISFEGLERDMELLNQFQFKTLVVDEIHYIANRTSLRYLNVKRLALRQRRLKTGKEEITLTPRIPYRIGVTGTAIPNKSVDLWSIMSILWPWRFHSFWDFAWEFSHPYRPRGRAYWIFSGARKPEKLRKLLLEHGMVRRLLVDTNKVLKKKRRYIIPVKLRDRTEYDEADRQFIKWLGKNLGKRQAKRAARMEAFTKIIYLLRMAARYKASVTTKWIDRHLAKGKKLVVFSFIKPLLKALEKRYGDKCVRIDGDVHGRRRMERIDRFQNDNSCMLALCNGKAVGVAVTLHAANWCLINDLPWSPAVLWQMEGRIHRWGQKKKTKFVYLIAVGTLEEKVMEVLRTKTRIIEKIMNRKSRRLDTEDLARLSKSMQRELLDSIRKSK